MRRGRNRPTLPRKGRCCGPRRVTILDTSRVVKHQKLLGIFAAILERRLNAQGVCTRTQSTFIVAGTSVPPAFTPRLMIKYLAPGPFTSEVEPTV